MHTFFTPARHGQTSVLRRRRFVVAALAATIAALLAKPGLAITSDEIAAIAVRGIGKCSDWRVIGACYWLRCGFDGCKIRASSKVGHFRPDLVVSVYGQHEAHPWAELRAVYGDAWTASIETWARLTGGTSPGSLLEGRSGLRFHEADATGHPLVEFGDFAAFDYVCAPQTLPLKPYWTSATDVMEWRQGTIDRLRPAAFVPGLREVGNWPLHTWGAVYPRTGWTRQSDAAKAAALVAQRAGDIVTRTEKHRVRLPFESRGTGHWPPKHLYERDSSSGLWQMVLPNAESECSSFGVNDIAHRSSWGGGRVGESREWIWNLWRPYKCCRKAGQRFVGSTQVVDWP